MSPRPAYAKAVHAFEAELSLCTTLSQDCAGIVSSTPREYWASVLFTALCTRGMSLLVLVPHSPWAKKQLEHWDYGATAVLTRTVFELRLTFFYLCVDRCGEDEWVCRKLLLNLHDCVTRSKLFEDMGANLETLSDLLQIAEQLRADLKQNIHFSAFSEKRKRSLLLGKDAFMSNLGDIAKSSGTPIENFRSAYRLMSQHAHGLPMAFYRIGEDRGRGVYTETEEAFTTMWLDFSRDVLAEARNEFSEIFRDARGVRN